MTHGRRAGDQDQPEKGARHSSTATADLDRPNPLAVRPRDVIIATGGHTGNRRVGRSSIRGGAEEHQQAWTAYVYQNARPSWPR